MESAVLANPGSGEQVVHKNRLQEYAQKACIQLPVYQTLNEAEPHIPQFRSIVMVDGATFVSPYTFARRREAEQYVAKFAFESIVNKIKKDGLLLIHNDAAFCKIILHEYAVKMKMDLPKYTTTESKARLPAFVTSVDFGGKTYTGGVGRSKKDAERIGARTVIEYILGQSDTTTLMAEIIKSKSKLFNSIHGDSGSPHDSTMPLGMRVTHHHGDTTIIGKDAHIVSTNANLSVHAADQSTTPTTEAPNEQNTCKVCSGCTVESIPAVTQNSQSEAPASKVLNSATNDPCLAQEIQVKEEFPLVDLVVPTSNFHGLTPTVLPSESQIIRTRVGRRSRRKNKRKTNTVISNCSNGVNLPVLPCESHTVNPPMVPTEFHIVNPSVIPSESPTMNPTMVQSESHAPKPPVLPSEPHLVNPTISTCESLCSDPPVLPSESLDVKLSVLPGEPHAVNLPVLPVESNVVEPPVLPSDSHDVNLPVLPSESQCPTPSTSGGKRSHMNNKRKNAKKTRVDN